MAGTPHGRPSRSGAPGGPGPDRRDAVDRWDLWNLRALWPEATADDLAAFRRRRADVLAREREALAGLWSGERGILSPGHRFLAANPDLADGLLVTLHQGPHALLLEALLARGLSPLVLVSAAARRVNADRTARLAARLGHRASVRWLPLEDGRSLPRLVRGLRAGSPAIAYLDGNLGRDGFAGTRAHGIPYRLPGRAIRVRTGLARLAIRLGVPLRTAAVRWNEDGRPAWERGPDLAPGPDGDPADVTRHLLDWGFGQVLARPEQWSFRGMLAASAACFGRASLDREPTSPGLRADYVRAYASCLARAPGTTRLHLEHALEVWPGDVLADLTCDCFYAAAGLADADLEPLRAGAPTLAELAAARGGPWVRFHGLRLCLLGAARLGT